jgi:hypothetical protein
VAGQLVFQAGDANAEGVTTREVQCMLLWVLVSLYSRFVQNPGAAANYNSKSKKRDSKKRRE